MAFGQDVLLIGVDLHPVREQGKILVADLDAPEGYETIPGPPLEGDGQDLDTPDYGGLPDLLGSCLDGVLDRRPAGRGKADG
jgi:hypothetical protein